MPPTSLGPRAGRRALRWALAVWVLLLPGLSAAPSPAAAGEDAEVGIRWEPDLAAGLERARREGRPILFAINALDFLGEKARPVLPAIRRSLTEDHRSVRKVARHIIDTLDGTFDPYAVNRSPGGGIQSDPTAEVPPGGPRPYD